MVRRVSAARRRQFRPRASSTRYRTPPSAQQNVAPANEERYVVARRAAGIFQITARVRNGAVAASSAHNAVIIQERRVRPRQRYCQGSASAAERTDCCEAHIRAHELPLIQTRDGKYYRVPPREMGPMRWLLCSRQMRRDQGQKTPPARPRAISTGHR